MRSAAHLEVELGVEREMVAHLTTELVVERDASAHLTKNFEEGRRIVDEMRANFPEVEKLKTYDPTVLCRDRMVAENAQYHPYT